MMDLALLRQLLEPLVIGLSARPHRELPAICSELGLPTPGTEEMTKRQRMEASFGALPDTQLPQVAQRFLGLHPPAVKVRNAIQDILWSDIPTPEIPKRFRREVSRAIGIDELFLKAEPFDRLLEELWALEDDQFASFSAIFGGVDRSLRAQIQQHVHRNPGDWSTEDLFEYLGAFDACDRRFALFLQGLTSADIRPEESGQREFVKKANTVLHQCGIELRETGSEGGYPIFTMVSMRGPSAGTPKNLIFASPVKPDIRFSDAVNNDIEIVTNADKVLVYDRPITPDGLLWSDLQKWWAEKRGIINDIDAKKSLYHRLKSSLPATSPPQILVFTAFYSGFGAAIHRLPALLPEVWLHWDPKTVKERGVEALLRFRMDFLLLLPGGVRVVVEIDGRHHFADHTGQADTNRYANMVAADRDLKLSGYEVFRFGVAELRRPEAKETVQSFFKKLFRRYHIDEKTSA